MWLPAANKFYLPPQPITRVKSTEEYVSRTDIFYHGATERLLTVGHPFYDVKDADGKVTVPKVSGNQYRVFRIRLPDPNNFAFNDRNIFDPEKERLVWAIRGLEIDRGQPLGISLSGNPQFNKLSDAENSFIYDNSQGQAQDKRQNVAFDPKQVQMFMVGCKPQTGEYWDVAPRCAETKYTKGDCPPIQLLTKTIEDGDMASIGMGNLNFKALQETRSDTTIDLVNTTSVYPDFLKMIEDPTGDSLFFYSRREQMYARHMFVRDGAVGEPMPAEVRFMSTDRTKAGPPNYGYTPSGSLVTSEAQLFNRPYWLQRAQGQNNGILWLNEMFVTVVDNTRGNIFAIVQKTADSTNYDPSKIKTYMRHVEEYQVACILQLCKVRLTPENLAFIHAMDPNIVEKWHLTVNTPPNQVIEDHYRYINSLATKCPDAVPPAENPDPYKDLKFWELDLSDKLTEQLDQTPLGRKFLYQTGLRQSDAGKAVVSNPSIRNVRTTKRPAKRRRTSKS